MQYPDLLNKSLRIRYEAYSNFASALSKASSPLETGQILAVNCKYILDVYLIRYYSCFLNSELTININRGAAIIGQAKDSSGLLEVWEKLALNGLLPKIYTRQERSEGKLFSGSLFDTDRINTLYTLPAQLPNKHSYVLTVGSKNTNAYNEADFRFIRLIGELLASKLSQLELQSNLKNKHDELKDANEELKALNEEVHQLNIKLEEKVSQRTQQLTYANLELSTLFYRTSHDFRRPLTSILGLANLAKHSTELKDIKQLFCMSADVVNELSAMLDKLKVLSVTDTEIPSKSILSGSDMLKDILENLSHQIKAKDLLINLECIGNPILYPYPNLVQSIIFNLLENAVNFCDARCEICVQLKLSDQSIFIKVADNGPGIPEEYHALIWNMYERAHVDSKGNGLGLYVVKKLTERLNGVIDFVSKSGQGSMFNITLPAA